MGDFFNGWRRKIGVATLVAALAFMGGWARSNEWHSLSFYSLDNQHYHQLILRPEGIEWTKEISGGSWKDHQTWLIPHEVLVYPLTLLSAFLLLTKARKSTPKKLTEPVPANGS